MARTLSELPDELLVAILSANFDAPSLANRLADGGMDADAECPHLVRHASQLVRRNQRFDRRLSSFLDRMHASRMVEVEDSEVELLQAWASAADFQRCSDFGGVLWAMARDSRPEVRAGTRVLLQRVLQEALRPRSCRAD